jgi:hypothetical protein
MLSLFIGVVTNRYCKHTPSLPASTLPPLTSPPLSPLSLRLHSSPSHFASTLPPLTSPQRFPSHFTFTHPLSLYFHSFPSQHGSEHQGDQAGGRAGLARTANAEADSQEQ